MNTHSLNLSQSWSHVGSVAIQLVSPSSSMLADGTQAKPQINLGGSFYHHFGLDRLLMREERGGDVMADRVSV